MVKNYTRVNVLLPLKQETLKVINGIIKMFCQDFGGVTHSRTGIPPTFEGLWFDEGAKRIVADRIIWLWTDVDLSNGIDIERYFIKFKHKYERMLKEKEIWITFQNTTRII